VKGTRFAACVGLFVVLCGALVLAPTARASSHPARAALSRLAPASAKPGSRVTLTGKRFGARRGKGYVRFGTVKCKSYLLWSATKIVCKVPAGAPLGRLTVTVHTAKGTSNAKRFTVKAPPPVVPATTKVLSAATVAGASTSDGVTYTFTNTKQTVDLAPGDVLVARPTAALPAGIFCKVAAVTDGGHSVSTAPATLEDTFKSAEFAADHTITQSDFQSAQVAPGVRLLRNLAAGPDSRLLTFRLTDIGVSRSQDLSANLGPLTVSGTITLSITVHVAGTIGAGAGGLPTVKSFTTSETNMISSDLQASMTADGSCSAEKTLASWGAGKIAGFTVWVGPVPLYFQPVLSIYVGADGQFNAGVHSEVRDSASSTLGLSYVNGTFKPIATISKPTHSYTPPTVRVSGSLKAYAGAQLGLDLYAAAGPYLRLDGYGKLTADVAQTPWWTLKAGLEGSVGAHIGIDAGFIKWDKDWKSSDLTLVEWTLAHASTPAPTPTISCVTSPGTDSPPATLGPYAMEAFGPDPSDEYTQESAVEGPTGAITFDSPQELLLVGDGWQTWSDGYTGDVYENTQSLADGSFETTITLPPNTGAFYLYAEPDMFEDFSMGATAEDGTTSGPLTVYGEAGAQYFGFYAGRGQAITTIQVTDSGGDEAMAIGEFGIAPSLVGASATHSPVASREQVQSNAAPSADPRASAGPNGATPTTMPGDRVPGENSN
jgi:hypothetical protein